MTQKFLAIASTLMLIVVAFGVVIAQEEEWEVVAEGDLVIKYKIEGALPEDMQLLVDDLIRSIKTSGNEVEIEIEYKYKAPSEEEAEAEKKLEVEMEGNITQGQQGIVDQLVASLKNYTDEDKIKIKVESEIKRDKRLQHRCNVVFHQMERLRIGMDEVINYAEEIDANAGKLIILRDEFVSKAAELNETAAQGDLTRFKGVLAHIRGIVKEFRLEAHSVLGDKVGEAQVRVATALQENKEYLQTLIDNIAKSRKDADLKAMDDAIEDADDKVKKLEEKGVNITQLKEKLEEVEEKREALKEKLDAAIESCVGVGLGACNTTEAQEYRAIKEEIKQEFRELREISRVTGMSLRIAKALEASEKVVERAKKRLERAEERGMDVTVEKAKLGQVEEILSESKEKLEAGDFEGALKELTAAREAYESIRELVKGKRIKGEEELERGKERVKDTKKPERERRP